jgi:hypothetical protein
MTSIIVPSSLAQTVLALSAAAGLRPGRMEGDGSPDRTLVYDPDLSPAEQATFDLALSLAKAHQQMTREAFAAIRPDVQVIRDLRQMGRNAFMALTAAERDRLLYDAQAATTTILLALLRE